MLWIVTIDDIQIPVRASSEQALLNQLEEMLDLPLETLNYNLRPLPDMAELLSNSQIIVPDTTRESN